ncbi:EF-hand domain-containing protein [Roseibium sp.]|uniref:EF-hand domain-containing protein n=1 Tax=Roseibium sp. TaxID=1936156 RepID=UPI003A9722E4
MNKMTAIVLAVTMTTTAAYAAPGTHFIESWDLNGDKAVTADEARERRSDVFASFDANDDGFIDAEEYKTFDEARANDQANHEPAGRGARNPANGMRLEVNDNDKDGKVSRDEFLGNAAAWITSIDRNGDGVVTTADFGPKK